MSASSMLPWKHNILSNLCVHERVQYLQWGRLEGCGGDFGCSWMAQLLVKENHEQNTQQAVWRGGNQMFIG